MTDTPMNTVTSTMTDTVMNTVTSTMTDTAMNIVTSTMTGTVMNIVTSTMTGTVMIMIRRMSMSMVTDIIMIRNKITGIFGIYTRSLTGWILAAE
jgi:hypothetical protein